MKPLEVLNHFFRALIRLIGIGFLISGLESFPNIFIDGGITKNIFTLILRLISVSIFITTGYWFIRLRKISILGISLILISSIIIPFYNLYFSTIANSSVQTYQFYDTVAYIIILLFFLFFKNNLFTDNFKNEINSHKVFILEIIFMVVITTIIFVVVYIKYINYNKNLIGVYYGEPTPTTIPTPTPTIIPTPTTTPTPRDTSGLVPPYKAVNNQDDNNSISRLVLIDKNHQQFFVEENEYMGPDIKGSYENFEFSKDYSFLYFLYHIWEGSSSVLYNIKNDTSVTLPFKADIYSFSSNSKYFFACGKGDFAYNYGGAIFKKLPSDDIFLAKERPFKCQYNQSTGVVTFLEIDNMEYFSTGKEIIINQFKFSTITGKLIN